MLGSLPPCRGLSSYCLELSTAVADLGPVEFISFLKMYPAFIYPGGDLEDDNTFPPLTCTNLKVNRRLTWYNPISWIYAGLFSNAKLLHAQWWSLPLWLVYMVICTGFKLRGKPIVFTVHNVLSHEGSYTFYMASRLLFKLGDHFIVHTKRNKEQLIKYYQIHPDQISLIPHGTLDFYLNSDADRNDIRKEMGFTPKQKVILIFGAVRAYKGIDTAFAAFSEVLKKIPEARLIIAGKLWEDWKPYEQFAKTLRINDYLSSYLNYIPSNEVYRFFSASDLVILPYHQFDSQSGVGTAAISFRKPMIVTDVGGLPELVSDSRFIVPPKNPDALAKAIISCLKDSDQLEVMSANTKIAAEKFAWSAIAQKTWAIYQRLVLGTKTCERS
ncbi:MAG: glycosyltransferase family 4 protein [Desulfobacterales bacterium]|nr:glycosyltransferase family 4 protein [Desulfobacterales bacterium]